MAAPILVVTGPSGAGKTTVGALVAAEFDSSVHIRMDDFMSFAVSGWVKPWLPDAAHQNHVLGGAVFAAAFHFAGGGYTVVVDGYVFPEALHPLTAWCADRGMTLHYAVLRPDLTTCAARGRRSAGDRDDLGSLARLHARFEDLGTYEANVIDSAGTPEEVAAAALSAFRSGRLLLA